MPTSSDPGFLPLQGGGEAVQGEGACSPRRRRILCVFPEYSRSFGTLHFAYPFIPGVKAFMPPQGILLIAAYLPKQWEVRFIDENIRPARHLGTLDVHAAHQNRVGPDIVRAHTYPRRIAVPNSRARLSLKNIYKGICIITNLVTKIGLRGRYRPTFWRMAKPAFKRGDIEGIIHVGLVAHHLIEFSRECRDGEESAAFYSQKLL